MGTTLSCAACFDETCKLVPQNSSLKDGQLWIYSWLHVCQVKFCPGCKSPVLTSRDWKILHIEEIPGYKSWKMKKGGCLKQDTAFLYRSFQTQLQKYPWIQWMWHRTPTTLWQNLTAFKSVNLVSCSIYSLIPRSLPYYKDALIEINLKSTTIIINIFWSMYIDLSVYVV